MARSVLLGGRATTSTRSFLGWLMLTWGPVCIMLVAIAVESTHAFSSDNTSGWMRSVYQLIVGAVSDRAWANIHHHIRKTGHFLGYGILGLTWLRGWLLFWLQPLASRTWKAWWGVSCSMSVFCTMLVASVDELHQSFLADRTGVVADVLLDTVGAVVLLAVACVLAVALRAGRSR